ncbi:MAG: hypothetical protein WC069_04200 [Candidatus Shapirobacteria bacterium]
MKNETTLLLEAREGGKGTAADQVDITALYKEIHERGGLDGKKILVVGSGDNTEFWKCLGCVTLDIDPAVNPDFVINANMLDNSAVEGGYDVVYCEFLKMDPNGEDGVNLNNLLRGSLNILKDGGMVVMESSVVDYEGEFEGSNDYGARALPVVSELIANAAGFSACKYSIGEGVATAENARRIGDETIASGIYYESPVLFVAVK